MSNVNRLALALMLAAGSACSDDDPIGPGPVPIDPATAPRVAVDRFSAEAGTLFVRTAENELPAANAAIDFDQGPFITHGLGPNGENLSYYNFDVMPDTPADLYVFYRAGSDQVVAGQLPVIDEIPGQEGYNDFRRVVRVNVPADYVANTAASLEAIEDAGFELAPTTQIVNYPVVPAGSTADLRINGAADLQQGWYRNQVFFYFGFTERALVAQQGKVPVAPIFVSFVINPDEEGGGPPSGFLTEEGSEQTHNVVSALPDEAGYSPLWNVIPYDNADFDLVVDLESVQALDTFDPLGLVNCPVVRIQ